MSSASRQEIPALRDAFGQFYRLLKLIRPYWPSLSKGIALGVVVGLLGMATPYLTKLLIDQVYPAQDFTLMHILVVGVLAFSIASSVTGAILGYYNLYVNTRLSNATSLLFFNHLQHLPMRFYNAHRVGEVTSRFGDVGRALQSVTGIFHTVFGQFVYLLLVPPFLFLLQWKLALVALVSIPLTAIITTLSGRLLRKYWKRSAEAYADLNALQVESLSQIRTLKTLALEHHVFHKAREQIDHAFRMQLKAGGFANLLGMVNGSLYALNTALFTWLGWTLILTQQMTLGDYIAFSAYIGYLYNPIRQLVTLFSDFQQTAVNLGRMFEYLDSPVEQDPTSAYEAPGSFRHQLSGQIEVCNVSFGYQPHQRVLDRLDLQIEPGTTLAIVGPSGSGKTSFLRLLTRLEQPDTGQIRFDGISSEHLSLSDLRRQIAVVWQEFSLLKGTLWENLTLGLGDIPRDHVEQILHTCQLETFIDSLEHGLQTPVAEWGTSLSGGQRQRVALARALIRDTPILLLDEVTSNVDVETENEILGNLFPAVESKTVIIVTHRVITAALADQICVLHEGQVEELGTHSFLMRNGGRYCRMYNLTSSSSSKDLLGGESPNGAPSRLPFATQDHDS